MATDSHAPTTDKSNPSRKDSLSKKERAERERAKKSLSESVRRRAAQKQRARKQAERNAWFGLGMFGLVGWSVAVPMLLGIALGVWLDRRFPSGTVSWTLTCLIVGIGLGCANAWYWVKQETRVDDNE